MRIQVKIGKMLSKIHTIIFILIAGFSLAQKPMIQLIVEPKVAQVNEEITVTIKTNIQGKINIDLPPSFVKGYNILSGMEQETDYTSGKSVTYYYLSQNGTINKEGTFSIGPAFIKKGRTVYKSKPVTIKIEKDKPTVTDDVSSRQMKKPAFGIIEKSKTKIYEGEPVVLSAKVYSHFNPTHLDGYQPFEMEGTMEKHMLGSGQQIMVDQKNIKGVQMFYFEYDRQLVFPSMTGKIAIEPFKMNLKSGIDGYSFASSGNYVEVMPLPTNAPSDFIGGVGKFSFTRSWEKGTYKQGDVFVLTLTVSGEGNLHNINTPKLDLPKGMVQYGDPIIEDQYSFGSNGAQGKIIYKYNIQLIDEGSLMIPDISISYFDVNKEQYITLKEKGESIPVSRNEKYSIAKTPDNTENTQDETLSISSLKPFVESSYSNPIITHPAFYVALFSPLGLAFLFIFFKKKKEKSLIQLEETNNKKQAKQIAWREIEIAENALKNNESDIFYGSIQKALMFACSIELKKEDAFVSKQNLFDELKENNVSEQFIDDLNTVFKSCEEARYGFGHDPDAQTFVLTSAKGIIVKLTDELNTNR